jgi:hypothetical protein
MDGRLRIDLSARWLGGLGVLLIAFATGPARALLRPNPSELRFHCERARGVCWLETTAGSLTSTRKIKGIRSARLLDRGDEVELLLVQQEQELRVSLGPSRSDRDELQQLTSAIDDFARSERDSLDVVVGRGDTTFWAGFAALMTLAIALIVRSSGRVRLVVDPQSGRLETIPRGWTSVRAQVVDLAQLTRLEVQTRGPVEVLVACLADGTSRSLWMGPRGSVGPKVASSVMPAAKVARAAAAERSSSAEPRA